MKTNIRSEHPIRLDNSLPTWYNLKACLPKASNTKKAVLPFMTYNEIVKALAEANIGDRDECAHEARLLAEHFCGIDASTLPFRRNEDMPNEALAKAVARRVRREPLQYILGSWMFMGLEFKLSSACLIPRPDTEVTVEAALRLLPHGAHFADLGTGSGAIAVSILKFRPDLSAEAADISRNALLIAEENARRHGVSERCRFICGDMLSNDLYSRLDAPLDAVISNPPYIPKRELIRGVVQPELEYEPYEALCGGDDGLMFYRSIIKSASHPEILKPDGCILFEVGIGEATAVADIVASYGFACEVLKDLGGIPRTLILTRSITSNM